MKLVYQKKNGLFPEIKGIAPLKYEARATIPVVEALRDVGSVVTPQVSPNQSVYTINLGDQMPTGIITVGINEYPGLGLRMENEPDYPIEYPSYWNQIDWTPCPVCGAPVVWYEAGYVPGYRICTRKPYHHCLATDDVAEISTTEKF